MEYEVRKCRIDQPPGPGWEPFAVGPPETVRIPSGNPVHQPDSHETRDVIFWRRLKPSRG